MIVNPSLLAFWCLREVDFLALFSNLAGLSIKTIYEELWVEFICLALIFLYNKFLIRYLLFIKVY